MPSIEMRRIQRHFDDVLGELRARDTRALEPAARATRATLIGALAGYAEAGTFPRNLDFPDAATPYFVDAAGVRCAVGHLMHVTGEDVLVADIAAHDNHARVADLAGDQSIGARLGAWLAQVGLDVDEAARIQPGYCMYEVVTCVCVAASPSHVVGNVEDLDINYVATVRVTAVHGDTDLAVGDVVKVQSLVDHGRVLVPLAADDTPSGSLAIHGDRVVVRCGDGAPEPLTADVVAAWDSGADCLATFRARDPLADRSGCVYEDEREDGGGCAGGPASSLLALMGSAALWLRRFRK